MSKTDILLESGTNELEILEFFINEIPSPGAEPKPAYFGINVAKVMQVIESPNLEAPESAPHPSFLGNIPLRGHILPVLDLSVWLHMDKIEAPHDIVIVTEFSQAVTGFLVSGVTEIHRVGWKEVIPPSGYVAAGTDAIIGLVNMEDHFIQLLDLETILSDMTRKDAASPQVRAERTYRALVADDSPTIRLLLQENLEAANFEPIMAGNGEEALTMVRRLRDQARSEGRPLDELVNIVISDIEMPLMDGFSLTKNIKNDKELDRLPVILYSSIITKELRHKGDSVGADAQISKPDIGLIPQMAIELIEGR